MSTKHRFPFEPWSTAKPELQKDGSTHIPIADQPGHWLVKYPPLPPSPEPTQCDECGHVFARDKFLRELPARLLESIVIPWLSKAANLTLEEWARFDYGDFLPRVFPQGAVIATGIVSTAFNIMNDGSRCTVRRKIPHSALNRNDTCFKSRLEDLQLTRVESGDWLYRFEDVQLLEKPIPMAGRQGIWRAELPALR